MPAGWVGAAAAVVGTASSLAKGSSQSGDVSEGQKQANEAVQPWVDTGKAANTAYANLTGINGQDAANTSMAQFQASPGYAYQVSEGQKAVDSGAAAKGMLRSGATLKAETTLGQNLANQDFAAYTGRLNTLAQTGYKAASGQSDTDTGAASNQATIAGNTANGVSNSLTSLAGNANVQNGLSSFFGSGSGGGETDTWDY